MKWTRLLLCTGILCSTSIISFADDPQPRVTKVLTSPQQAGVLVIDKQPLDLGKYWIGVSVSQVSDTLREHLPLTDGMGVVASELVDKGPAKAAGIEKHDVLLKAGDAPLRSAKDLVDAVNKAETKDLSIELIHKGQKKTITVKPAERPAEARQPVDMRQLAHLPPHLHQRILNLNTADGQALVFVQPGIPLGMPPVQDAPLPPGVSVTVTRTNQDPAKITVKRDKDAWEITEKELDKLPADLRPHVEAMLHRTPGKVAWTPAPVVAPPVPGFAPGQVRVRTIQPERQEEDAPVRKRDLIELEQKLKDLSQKLDELNKKN